MLCRYDISQSGVLDASQLKDFLKGLNHGVAPDEGDVAEILAAVGLEKKGKITRRDLMPAVRLWYVEAAVSLSQRKAQEKKTKSKACSLM